MSLQAPLDEISKEFRKVAERINTLILLILKMLNHTSRCDTFSFVISLYHYFHTYQLIWEIFSLIKYIHEQKILFSKEIDSICLIVDRDEDSFLCTSEHEQYHYVIEKCHEHGIQFFITNPCFEFWLLMHFDEVNLVNRKKWRIILKSQKNGGMLDAN